MRKLRGENDKMGLKDLFTSAYDSAARTYYEGQKESLKNDTQTLSRYGTLSSEQKAQVKQEYKKYDDGYNRHNR